MITNLILLVLAAYFVYVVVQFVRRRRAGQSGSLPALAFIPLASLPEIDVDLSPLFESLATYVPIFIAIFGIAGGIAAAVVLARFVINAVISAFRGGEV